MSGQTNGSREVDQRSALTMGDPGQGQSLFVNHNLPTQRLAGLEEQHKQDREPMKTWKGKKKKQFVFCVIFLIPAQILD